jgi:hypothetical protein
MTGSREASPDTHRTSGEKAAPIDPSPHDVSNNILVSVAFHQGPLSVERH